MNTSIISGRKVRRLNIKYLETIKTAVDSLVEAPIISKDSEYGFKQFLFGEESPAITFEIMREFSNFVAQCYSEIKMPDAILSPEPNGVIWGTIASLELGKPSVFARLVCKETGLATILNDYSSKILEIGLTGNGESIAIVDDVISTGATLKSIKEQAEYAGFVVTSVITLHSLIDVEPLSQDLCVPIFCLVDNVHWN